MNEPTWLLVAARSPAEARRLVAAFDDSADTRDPAEWTAETVAVEPPARFVGVWHAPDAVWASLGYIPSEDWHECERCGKIREVEDFDFDNGDVCDHCANETEAP